MAVNWYLLIDGVSWEVGLEGGGSCWEALGRLPYLVHISCWCSWSRERLPDTQNTWISYSIKGRVKQVAAVGESQHFDE